MLWGALSGSLIREKEKDRDRDCDPPLRQLFIRYHPAMLDAVSEAFEKAIQRFQEDVYTQFRHGPEPGEARRTAHEAETKASIGFWHRRLCSFEVVGPMATDAIKSCLRPVNGTSADKLKVRRRKQH